MMSLSMFNGIERHLATTLANAERRSQRMMDRAIQAHDHGDDQRRRAAQDAYTEACREEDSARRALDRHRWNANIDWDALDDAWVARQAAKQAAREGGRV